MNMLDAILSAQGGGAVRQLGQQFGLNKSQAGSAISALAPALAAGFSRNMSSPQGIDGLLQPWRVASISDTSTMSRR